MGGQSGIKDNIEIGKKVTVIARAVVTTNTKDKEVLEEVNKQSMFMVITNKRHFNH